MADEEMKAPAGSQSGHASAGRSDQELLAVAIAHRPLFLSVKNKKARAKVNAKPQEEKDQQKIEHGKAKKNARTRPRRIARTRERRKRVNMATVASHSSPTRRKGPWPSWPPLARRSRFCRLAVT